MKTTMILFLCVLASACGTIDSELQIDCMEMSDNTQCEVVKREPKPCVMKGCRF